MQHDLALLINGSWIVPSSGRSSPVINPATEAEIGRLPHAGVDDLDRALEAAAAGFKLWRQVLPQERAKVVRRFADLMREHVDLLAAAITAEQGKTLAEARGEVQGAAELAEWLAEEGRRIYGRIVPSRFPNSRIRVEHEPVGPVAAFSPWNFPCSMVARKIAHALAAGCSIVIKPAEETPGAAIILGHLCLKAGVPPGVVNIVFGAPAQVSEHLIASPIIQKISLTGSVGVGKHIAMLAARELKKVTLELGGHSPAVICEDADIAAAAQMCVQSRFRNAGQVCTAATRFYVHASVAESFTRQFVQHVAAIKVGDGTAPGVQMGPLSNQRRLDAMDRFVADAEARGARLVAGGQRIGNRGYFFAPTVFTDIPADAEVMTQEPFGPMAPIRSFDTLDEVIASANSLPFGLAAYGFTRSHRTAERLSSGLRAGVVAINGVTVTAPEAPFGGVGDSGVGRESGSEGLLEYTHVKTVTETFN
ncbi:NAD-dependent succinate-semialdehyde dehydrogenase [Ancylobacter vacuolatus]|uniref:Succinate-semialdehyde dehydrogenase/glutarate-semialdehyde dehydrogenase n=1 Tax=Ancylobacter vacuolatus TaxID=223389 RepID=A0ABU0DE81_9HYPH|nr:NAD-dependent succinate-semialdehyde dehydrogenase [Ancylobacter vacuolatus]MDQ0346727.1 succinate-semialdehyde dehydrogenase/glutarate-semialdehyde dehydrogenase [Ancylobacter vacuolatus]